MRPRRLLLALAAAFALSVAHAAGLSSHDDKGKRGANADPQQMDCQKMASMPYAPMTVEQCEAMKSMATSAQAAMHDTSAARPGDEQMSCEQIAAEMQTLDVRGVSDAHRKQSLAAGQDLQAEVGKQQREAAAIGARETAEVQAAMAADSATQLATAGLVQGKATRAVEQRQQEENRKTGERMAREMQPKQQAALTSVTGSGNDLVQSMQSNPRFARLISLASSKSCKQPGR
jgi:hypothetical protein